MAGLRLFTGNRMEILADALAELLSVPLSSPLASEIIIVQSRGMERWLSMELARRMGVCANVRFPFPRTFTEDAFAAVLGERRPGGAFSIDVMTWKIMKLLPSLLSEPAFDRIRRYLENESSSRPFPSDPGEGGFVSRGEESRRPDAGAGLRRFQLARRIAYSFDQYIVFRPGMIASWDRGKTGVGDEEWQSRLWRCLLETSVRHPAALREAFMGEIAAPSPPRPDLPERIALFGISTLPRFYLEIFHALSERMEVNFFLMNPSLEFWGDIRSDKERHRELERVREGGRDCGFSGEELHIERGNRLLSSLGGAGREFFPLVWGLPCEERELYEEPGEGSLLCAVQSDILNLRDRAGEEKPTVSREDRSIQFHSCHSNLREIEVLYDNLLSLFDRDRELLPGDVLVMAPDIELYAPLIQSVFSVPENASDYRRRCQLPFTIADRNCRLESSVIEGFMGVMDLAGGRLEASRVLALLEMPEIMARFGFTAAEWETACRWVAESGIRWGRDGEDRRRLGLPDIEENTWEQGLRRLLAGYAMPRNGGLIEGILPCDLEGSETAILGKLLEYTERLFYHVAALSERRTLREWSRTLGDMLADLFRPQEDNGVAKLQDALDRLETLTDAAGFDESLDRDVIRSYLEDFLQESGFGYGFLSGGVTFCSMLPMRSIPGKVICLLGMNGSDYPRSSWLPGFDLMGQRPQPGDRSRRKDDRYLFLETILSARKTLIISYLGQSGADNSVMPPSVLVSELLDYLGENFVGEDGAPVADSLVTQHRLQAFSPAYFQGTDRLFSYSEENCRAAQCLTGVKTTTVRPHFRLGLPAEEWRDLAVADLAAFFSDPVKFFLQRRLGIYFEKFPLFPEAEERFELGGLDRYALAQEMTERGTAGEDLRDYMAVARAAGLLPHGVVGNYYYRSLLGEVKGMVDKVRPLRQEGGPSFVDVDFPVGEFRIRGRIPLHKGIFMNYRCASLKAKDHLNMWVHYLTLHAFLKGEAPSAPALLLGRDECWLYDPPQDAEAKLASCLERYWEGLVSPLKFFPLSSWKYGEETIALGKTEKEALRAATLLWEGSDYGAGEKGNLYYRLCFDPQKALDDAFCRKAEDLLAELFACRRKAESGEF